MKAAIFDMDGTMINNMMVHHRAWQQVLEKYGMKMTLEEVHKQIHGVNLEILERLFGDKYSVEDRTNIAREKEEKYRSDYRAEMSLLPGVYDFLQELVDNDMPVAVASAAPGENVDFVLDGLQIRGFFSSVLHAGDVKNGKPHPEIYLSTTEILGVLPADCMVFEDSPAGARAAATAGCSSIIVTTTHEPAEFEGIEGIKGFVDDFQDPLIEHLL